ncbi:GNAT family N-acetyltransferase [uncultured Vibrio sp.]|uniref:GNAT family N-acetyltransferase n=1 Tax=uncultured Vibrio sp. TaxID=114054 RepID=UPI0025F58089|nr:GNAT family N-acetyltransferase [uncultured Vibrio sp.]
MTKEDLPSAALVHQSAFVRQKDSSEWLTCNLNAFPRYLIYVAEDSEDILGYIIWVQKSGFRPEAVLELEQLAVTPKSQGKGIGRKLIVDSLPQVKQQLALKYSVLKHILVTTRADNFAQELYRSTLGAEVETTISNLYSADEVLMIARNVGSRIV